MHTYGPSTWEAESDPSSLKPDWATEQDYYPIWEGNETLPQNIQNINNSSNALKELSKEHWSYWACFTVHAKAEQMKY